jgi:hypothetical protein
MTRHHQRYRSKINKSCPRIRVPSISSRTPARLKLIVAAATIQINTVYTLPARFWLSRCNGATNVGKTLWPEVASRTLHPKTVYRANCHWWSPPSVGRFHFRENFEALKHEQENVSTNRPRQTSQNVDILHLFGKFTTKHDHQQGKGSWQP